MGHNSVVSGHPKSTGISRVDGLSTGPSDLGRHMMWGLFLDSPREGTQPEFPFLNSGDPPDTPTDSGKKKKKTFHFV